MAGKLMTEKAAEINHRETVTSTTRNRKSYYINGRGSQTIGLAQSVLRKAREKGCVIQEAIIHGVNGSEIFSMRINGCQAYVQDGELCFFIYKGTMAEAAAAIKEISQFIDIFFGHPGIERVSFSLPSDNDCRRDIIARLRMKRRTRIASQKKG